MVARVRTVAFQGIEVLDVETQVTIAAGLPAFTVVGLPDKAVAESRERVRAALAALGLALPPKRITVNLAPADLLKEGSHFDLPIALGLLAAMEVLPADEIEGYIALGELALDGSLPPVAGVLPRGAGRGARRSAASSAPRRAAARRPGPARSRSWRRRSCSRCQSFQGHAGAAAARAARRRGAARRRSTSRTSRARRAPSARSRSPPPAATIC